MHAITAVILAGGAGTRAGGRDKGLIEHEGVALVEHVRRRLACQLPCIWISANRNRERYAAFGERVVADTIDGYAGPLAGIAAVLAACETELILTVPVDALAFPDDLAERLAAAPDAPVRVARDGTRRQPLFALYHRTLAGDAAKVAASEDAAVWKFQDRHGAREVAFRGSRFENLNVPQG